MFYLLLGLPLWTYPNDDMAGDRHVKDYVFWQTHGLSVIMIIICYLATDTAK